MDDREKISEELENFSHVQSELLLMINTYSLHTCAWIHGALNQMVEMLNDKMAKHYGEDK